MHIGYVLLNCDLGAEEYVVEELGRMPPVEQAYLTFGAYDVVAEIHAGGQDEFEQTVAKIRKLSRVVSTMTLNVVS